MTVRLARSHGQKTSTVEVPVDEHRGGFRGCLITSDDADYEAARKVWNGLIDRRPGLIAQCTGVVDVIAAVNFANNHDLLVAVRGGGGNYGVVTAFEYRLHPVGPIVLAGAAFYPWERTKESTQFYLDYVKTIPDDLTMAVFYWTAPPAPFLPASAHGRQFAIIAVCHAGSVQDGEKVVAPVRALKPEVDLLGPFPYTAFQMMFDPFLPHGILANAKSDYFDEISPGAVAEMMTRAQTLPAPLAMVRLNHYGGAVSAVSSEATAFAHRDAVFALNLDAFWHEPAESEKNVRWVREFWGAMHPGAPTLTS